MAEDPIPSESDHFIPKSENDIPFASSVNAREPQTWFEALDERKKLIIGIFLGIIAFGLALIIVVIAQPSSSRLASAVGLTQSLEFQVIKPGFY